MQGRLVIAGLAALLAAPAFLIEPASAAILFTCDSVTGSGVLSPGFVHDKRAQSLSSGPTARAGPANITLASTSDTGVKGDRGAFIHSMAADGTFVVFASDSTNLDPADTDAIDDLFKKNLATGDVTLVSTSEAGVKGNGRSQFPTLSADGTKLAFFSQATNLDPGDTDTIDDVYVKDLSTGDITLASTSDTGAKGDGEATTFGEAWISLSADGTRVAFASEATNLDPADTDSAPDVYVKNLNNGNLKLASKSATGVKSNGESYHVSLSADGTKVAFASHATNFDPADTNGSTDIFVKNLTTGAITLASTSDTGALANNGSDGPVLTADATRVAFSSRADNLDPGDSPGLVQDVFVKDLTTGDITLASTSDTGVKGNNNSSVSALSDDGTKVVFSSGSINLDPNNVNAYGDVYVKNLTTGDITLVSASDTGVDANAGNTGLGLPSADFTRVSFLTNANNLDPADTDVNYDIYVKDLPTVPTAVEIAGCSNGNSGTASIVDIRSYGPRPLGCPVALGGVAGNDYADTTPILVGATLSMTIDWASGPNSYGIAAAKAAPTGMQWRFRLAITASPGHDTPATNQYLPAAGSGFTKTRLQGKLDVSALDSFNCTSGTADPLSWLSLANNGTWVAKTS